MKSSRNRAVAFFSALLFVLHPLPAQFKPALPGYHFEFPRDYFNHPEFQTEWWYYTGNLRAADGHKFGFELTFFRSGVSRDSSKTSQWDVRDLYVAHFALSDLDAVVQGVRSVVRQDGHFSLRDNFAAVDSGIDIVDSASR